MSLAGRQRVLYQVMNAKGTTGIGNTIAVKDFRNCVVKVGTAGNASLTLKAQGAIASYATPDIMPDFAAAQTVANNWDYIQFVDLNNGNAITGDTGLVLTGTDDFRLFEININGLDFINFNITAIAAGTVTIEIQLTTNI